MDTKELTTPVGNHKVVVKEYITGRDMRALKEIYLKVGKIGLDGQTITDIDPKIAEEAENKTIELAIVSVDGVGEGILEKILDMPAQDYTYLIEEINEMAGLSKKN